MTNDTPLISVIMPAYNSERFIAETLETVLAQTYRNIEVIVVDDGSKDSTPDIVRGFVARDPRVRLMQQANSGSPVARNAGFAASRGAFVAPVDSDDLWFPDKLEQQLAVFAQNGPEVGLVYSWSLYVDAQGKPLGSYSAFAEEGKVFLQMFCHNFVNNGSVPLIRRAAIEQTGGYQNDCVEDADLFMRIGDKWEFRVARQFHVAYRQASSSLTRNQERMERSYKIFLDDTARHYPHIPKKVYRWSQGIFYVYLATKVAGAQGLRAALPMLARAVWYDPGAALRIAAWAFGRVFGPRPAVPPGATWRDRPDPATVRLSPNPLGPLAPMRLAYMARVKYA